MTYKEDVASVKVASRNRQKKEECCGCTACYAICPKETISMDEDEEGFEQPQVDKSKCIQCYQCIKVCSIKAVKENS